MTESRFFFSVSKRDAAPSCGTYTYDTNAAVLYNREPAGGVFRIVGIERPTTVTEMYSYTQPGGIAGKRMRIAKSTGQPADLNATWSYS